LPHIGDNFLEIREPVWIEFDEEPWMIADNHFGHFNIIRYTGRPFSSSREMDYVMVQNWNEVVKSDDFLLHLGDFGLTASKRMEEIISQLNGRKWIIVGNHDKSANWYENHGFERAFNTPLEVEDCILSHRPRVPCPKLNIHGHIHEKTMDLPGYVCVSVEHTDYKPVRLNQVLESYRKEGK
jgi:calcineurin-like phosphoesterase family protein